ncbi:GTPase Era [Acidihalobacter prosperus]|uniref:GTPase Era n=1 Tax=Acidihalobacter prosperus TaxID=160660 RepID=A0A1A6C765_9GAMM|nr:GTPase Era [Acidihalobacter prosperus]OBS10406.1 GTPase Era [Acidihalobacter prosperus]
MSDEAHQVLHAGHVAIVGRPNVGKSTLLNRLLGQKLSITADKPQTTRHRILGVLDMPQGQIALLDTPGIHRLPGKRALNQSLNRAALGALAEADLVWFVVMADRWEDEDAYILDALRREARPVMLVVNKIDRLSDRARLLPFLQKMQALYAFVEMFPVSALKGDNADRLAETSLRYLPVVEAKPFAEDQLTDRSLRFVSAEFIREQVMRSLGDEVPYAAAVTIDRFEEGDKLTRIAATIWVERDGQKAIVIGRGGERLKAIGSQARKSLETLLDTRVFLELWVKVRAGWQDDPRLLQQLEMDEARWPKT